MVELVLLWQIEEVFADGPLDWRAFFGHHPEGCAVRAGIERVQPGGVGVDGLGLEVWAGGRRGGDLGQGGGVPGDKFAGLGVEGEGFRWGGAILTHYVTGQF